MTQLWQCLLPLGVIAISGVASDRQFLPIFDRDARSLRDTFPFNVADNADHHHHEEHRDDVADVRDFDARDSRQGSDSSSSIPFNDVASSYAQGKRCIDKVFMEERTEYDTEVTCQHSYNRRCAKSLVTVYNAAQEEECEENYKKNCFIEYSKTAVNVSSRLCRTPLVKDCDAGGEEICRTEYESECWTTQEEHDVEDDVVECRTEVEEKCEDETSGYTTNTKCSKWPREVCSVSKQPVKKFTPLTRCDKVPVELCAPAGCGLKPGLEECQDVTKTIIGDNPEETCSLDPQRTCKHVTKLVPSLKEVEKCFDVPKEVCVRSEVNPRTVKVPVIKKWCYVVSCPDECVEAAKAGQCPANCKEHEGNSRCCAPCSLECQEAARDGQCPANCRQYEGNPTCCGGCPQKCLDSASRKETEPSCRQYRGNDQCYYEDPCPSQCRANPAQESCRRYSAIPGCYTAPVEACPDLPQGFTTTRDDCEQAAKRGECLNECWLAYDILAGCCPTCPNICKEFARQEQTFKNATINLDCADFEDAECYFECPQRCRDAFNRGETRDDCEKYDYLDRCYKPPPCSKTCLAAAKNEQCPAECEQFRGKSECCFECPVMCQEAYNDGDSDERCAKYSYLPQCYRQCPTKCEESFKKGVTDRDCERFASVPGCYYTPCPQACMTAAANDQCPRQCEKYEGNRACCGGCPKECKNAFSLGRTEEKCRKYNSEYENCFYEECPKKCMDAAAQGKCPSDCEQYAGNPNCCIRSDCPVECQEKSLWGECPRQCREFAGNPDCCAPTCPAKCTNRRRKECSGGGVEECDGIPGCCPEHFDVVFGAGVYLRPSNDQ